MTEDLNPLSLHGRRVLVTGAASGIGFATCALLGRLGARVVAVDLDGPGLAGVERELAGEGHAVRRCDLREVESIPSWMEEIASEGGPLSGVVHAAGVRSIQPVRSLAPSNYRDVLLVNTEAALALAKGFQSRKVVDSSGGSLVFISSVMAFAGSPGAAAYSLSKAALHGLGRTLAIELAPRNIRVNSVAPGFVKTPMFERVSAMWSAEQRARVEADHPLGLGAPGDVANACAFLLADTGRWITGSVLVVDGGYTAH